MGKMAIVFIILVLILSFAMAAISESNQTLLQVCYSNVQKPLFRQHNHITSDPAEWCRAKYPLY